MKFGIFDHFDANERPVPRQFADRIEYVAAAERAGYYCYHIAEHHATPLNMAPVPGIFLGALAPCDIQDSARPFRILAAALFTAAVN
jgi:alkanesulfonate monooxygenase SsuD/methylene tetrahydromethanopterin reductase-like flavin-dependent oxidoreductase (luciferase family)